MRKINTNCVLYFRLQISVNTRHFFHVKKKTVVQPLSPSSFFFRPQIEKKKESTKKMRVDGGSYFTWPNETKWDRRDKVRQEGQSETGGMIRDAFLGHLGTKKERGRSVF